MLDLIFTNEANMVASIEYQSPLGKSDHSVLRFDFKCYTVIQNYTQKKIYYDKADYKAINEALHKIEWENELQDKSVDYQWTSFKESVKESYANMSQVRQ